MKSNFLKRIVTSLSLIVILSLGLYYNDTSWKILLIFISFLCFYEFYNLFNKMHLNRILNLIVNFLMCLYLIFFYYLAVRVKIEFGEELILILLFACILSDVGGYIVGKLIGGRKLTSISPNKTVSGSLGSILFTILGTSLFILFLKEIDKDLFNIKLSFLMYFWMILMSLYCQIGDLFVSYLKRKAKVKDTGNILPGHGGILDRVDGIIFAIPSGIFTYYILFFNSSL